MTKQYRDGQQKVLALQGSAIAARDVVQKAANAQPANVNTVREALDDWQTALENLRDTNNQLQSQYPHGSIYWHWHESVDDAIHIALN